MSDEKYFIAVISKDHASKGIEGGFIQVCHGKKTPLTKMKKNDWIIIYSPKQSMTGNEKYQKFTGIGQTVDDDVFQFEMTRDFIPFRRRIKFMDVRETSILPMIENLQFIENKKSWGFPFRFGFLEISEQDFQFIFSNMQVYEKDRQYIQL